MKILVLTSVFPNSKQPTLGVFIRERMFRVAKHCKIKVIAPVPWFPFVRYIKKDYRPRVPYLEVQDGIEVYHPRFFNIPKFFKFMDGFFFFISSIFTVWKVRKRFRFDIIDSHFVYPDGFGAVLLGKLFKKPVIITVRESTISRILNNPLLKSQVKYAFKKAIKLFTVCSELKKAVKRIGIPEEKIVVISNGVDIKKFSPMQKERARRELGLPMEEKIIISVGWLIERKGFHRVISILPKIKKVIPDIMYVIVGGASVEGNFEQVLRRMVKELGLDKNVIFAGPQPHDKLYKWLSASDVFCLATSNEGWANVFLEAMACGLPVVTTKVGGNGEVVSSEDYGMLFNLEDKEELLDAIIRAFSKNWDRERIIHYAGLNTWDTRVNQLISQFREVMTSHNTCLSAKVAVR